MSDLSHQYSALVSGLDNGSNSFQDVIAFIDSHFEYTPTKFSNGNLINEAGENQGSCKVLGFGKFYGLTELDTLKLFAEHYEAVLANPGGSDHQNIRQFQARGWLGVVFDGTALEPREPN